MFHPHALLRACSLAALLAAALGCSGGKSGPGSVGPTTTVTGKVTVGGKPLTGGMIAFHSAGDMSKNSSGAIKGDGTYEVTGVPPGECKVAIDNSSLKNAPTVAGGADVPGMAGATKYMPIDAKYAKPESSGLTATVKGEKDTADFDLK